jgi:DNA-binding NtrC family response regulator
VKKNKYPSHPVLLVDDEEHFLESCSIGLRAAGINNIIALRAGREVVPLLAGREVDAVLLDVWMPHISGKDLLPRLSQDFPHVPVIILTGVDELETAVECMKSGAFDYMTKPVEESRKQRTWKSWATGPLNTSRTN